MSARESLYQRVQDFGGVCFMGLGNKRLPGMFRGEDVTVYLSELSCQDTYVFGVVPVS